MYFDVKTTKHNARTKPGAAELKTGKFRLETAEISPSHQPKDDGSDEQNTIPVQDHQK